DQGRSLIIEYRSADGRAERFPALAAELVRLNVDVIVTRGTPSALAARNATRTIPIVMASVGDVIGTGIAVSLARPGGNVNGAAGDEHGHRGETARAAQGDGAGPRPDCGPVQHGQPHLCAALEGS